MIRTSSFYKRQTFIYWCLFQLIVMATSFNFDHQAIESGKQYEVSQSQMRLIRGEEFLSLKSQRKQGKRERNKNRVQTKWNNKHSWNSEKSPRNSEHDHCTVKQAKCGISGTQHNKNKCPIKGTVCKYCHKPDH